MVADIAIVVFLFLYADVFISEWCLEYLFTCIQIPLMTRYGTDQAA